MPLPSLGLAVSLLAWSEPPALPEVAPPPVESPEAAEPTPGPDPAVPVQQVEPLSPESAPPPSVGPEGAWPDPPELTPEDAEDPEVETPEIGSPFEKERAPNIGRSRLPGYVPIRPPSWRGTGMLVASGVAFVHAITLQGVDTLVFGNQATGGMERAMMTATVALATGGAAVRARADAYDDTALKRRRPNTKRALVTGAVLTGVGAVTGLVNEGLWWRCVFAGSGPYRVEPEQEFGRSMFDCRYGLTRGLLDLSTATTSAGLGLMTWALIYRRDARAYSRARVLGLRPTLGRDRWGLHLEGRF